MTTRRPILYISATFLRPGARPGRRASCRRRLAAGAADRPGILEAQLRLLGAGRVLPVRQPAVERDLDAAGDSGAAVEHQDAERLHGRRPRAELHLHHVAQAEDGLHRRRPARQPRSAADVQGRVRAVGGSRRLRRLFSKKRPDGLTRTSSALDIFTAYRGVEASEALYNENLKAIDDLLVTKHHFALLDGDIKGVEYVYHAFYNFGPQLNYSSTGGFGGRYQPTYADLMVATDEAGLNRSFLANDENFQFMKSLEAKNLLVPVVCASTTTPSRRRMIWTGSSVTRRECTDRSIGQFSDFWSPRKDEPRCTPLPVRHSPQPAKMENEANKS